MSLCCGGFQKTGENQGAERKDFYRFQFIYVIIQFCVLHVCVCMEMRTRMCDSTLLEVRGQLLDLDSHLASL